MFRDVLSRSIVTHDLWQLTPSYWNHILTIPSSSLLWLQKVAKFLAVAIAIERSSIFHRIFKKYDIFNPFTPRNYLCGYKDRWHINIGFSVSWKRTFCLFAYTMRLKYVSKKFHVIFLLVHHFFDLFNFQFIAALLTIQ